MVGKKPAVAGAVGSTALATSPVRVPRRACIEYISGRFPLGEEAEAYAGLRFDQLDPEAKQQIRKYKFVVRTLPELSQDEIREIFGRLNRNNVALNRQELRQATYWGEFIEFVNSTAQRKFWVDSGLFTTNDIRRMLDVEYVSEVTIGALYGPQNKKSSLDGYFAAYESEFPDKGRAETIFDRVLDELTHVLERPNRLRWSRKVDFYTLFLVMSEKVDDFPLPSDMRAQIAQRLIDFSAAVKIALTVTDEEIEPDRSPIGRTARKYARGVRNSSDLGSRRIRLSALRSYLWGGGVSDSEELSTHELPESGGVPANLPTMEELYSSVEEPEEEEEEEEEEE